MTDRSVGNIFNLYGILKKINDERVPSPFTDGIFP